MKKISILFMLLLGITTLYAQQLNITGTVIDKKLNEPIIGATVQVTMDPSRTWKVSFL